MVLACLGCGFESGGIPGATGSASIGTADDDATATTVDGLTDGGPPPGGTGSGDPSPDSDPDPDPDPTTASTDTPTSTTGGTDTTGEPDPTTPMDTGSSTTNEGDAESSSDDGDVQDQPFYGDCTISTDCGNGVCGYLELTPDPDAAVCLLPCDQGICPAPTGGEAQPVCTINNSCELDCGMDLQGCPTGMDCYIFPSDNGPFARCLWTQD